MEDIWLSRYEVTLIDQILLFIDLHYRNDLSAEGLALVGGAQRQKAALSTESPVEDNIPKVHR
jgi:hypothetical protein